ncbi:hypothetical protein ATCC90586_009018 [Pythium insidiosum]|nr:hypothetical protein ATCC90586_009018 [Pythium insidiosum]
MALADACDVAAAPHAAGLQWLLDAYRAMLPAKPLVEKLVARYELNQTWSSLAFQDAVMETVIRDPICEKFAPQPIYTYRFLKRYMDALEGVGADVSDALAEELIQLVSVSSVLDPTSLDPDHMHHVTYRVPRQIARTEQDVTVTCRVASVFNEVGLKIWEAGWFLAEYALAHRELFEQRSVLELGAGVGITGIILGKCVAARRLLLSDYAPKVMQNLRYNIEINAQLGRPYLAHDVAAEVIDWETWQPAEEGSDDTIRPDILLAGDCVYDVSTFPSLVRVLHAFLGPRQEQPSAPSPYREAIFAATIRNQATFEAFLSTLAEHQIMYEDITSASLARMTPEPLFPYENRHQIRLCRLYRTPFTA